MSFQIVKGWPAEGAIDMSLTKETGEDMSLGQIVKVNASGKLEVCTAGANDTDPMGFTIGNELATKSINPDYSPEVNTFTTLFSECVIDCDSNHFDSGSIGGMVTADGGKFIEKTTTDDKPAIGKVLYKDTDKMRVHFFGNK